MLDKLLDFCLKDKNTFSEQPYPYSLIHSYENPIDKETDSYYFSRDTKKSWTTEDAEQWFSEPNGVLLNELENKNTKKVKDILEAVP